MITLKAAAKLELLCCIFVAKLGIRNLYTLTRSNLNLELSMSFCWINQSLITLKAGAKLELLFNRPAFVHT